MIRFRTLSVFTLIALNSSVAIADVQISDAHVRATNGPVSAGYLTLKSDADERLVSVHCDCSAMTELHTTRTDDEGVMQMRPLDDGIELPKDKAIQLAPGGLHIMFMQLHEHLQPGSEVELTLNFEHSGSQIITAPVMSMMKGMDHSDHKGH